MNQLRSTLRAADDLERIVKRDTYVEQRRPPRFGACPYCKTREMDDGTRAVVIVRPKGEVVITCRFCGLNGWALQVASTPSRPSLLLLAAIAFMTGAVVYFAVSIL